MTVPGLLQWLLFPCFIFMLHLLGSFRSSFITITIQITHKIYDWVLFKRWHHKMKYTAHQHVLNGFQSLYTALSSLMNLTLWHHLTDLGQFSLPSVSNCQLTAHKSSREQMKTRFAFPLKGNFRVRTVIIITD